MAAPSERDRVRFSEQGAFKLLEFAWISPQASPLSGPGASSLSVDTVTLPSCGSSFYVAPLMVAIHQYGSLVYQP
jgi:hypothetical protein